MAARRSRSQGRPEDFEPLVRGFLRLPLKAQIVIGVALLVVGIIVAIVQYRARQHPGSAQNPTNTTPNPGGSASASSDPSVQMLLGNPSGATADASNRDNYLMVKPYFALSYNNSKGTPNWVSWRVTAADLGDAPRKQLFDADVLLPPGFKAVVHKDYTGGGFDRGHMCPHGDRGANTDMSYATFVMTNIIPQAPNVNQKAWAQFEVYTRDMVRRGGQRLYVISGPHGQGGVGSVGPASSVGKGKVTVPASCWKLVVGVPDSGPDDPSKISADARVIGIDMPNDNTAVGEAWAGFRVTPAQIEAKTGYRFFDRLPPEVADSLRKKLDTQYVPPPKPMNYNRE